jgi:hypothetical protein
MGGAELAADQRKILAFAVAGRRRRQSQQWHVAQLAWARLPSLAIKASRTRITPVKKVIAPAVEV